MYGVFDLYEYPELIGEAQSMKDVRKIAKQRVKDTDGECQIFYCKQDKDGNYNSSNLVFLQSV